MKDTTILIVTTIITVAIITLLISNKEREPLASSQASDHDFLGKKGLVSKRVSRFLEQNKDDRYHRRNPIAADHCHKDYGVCESLYGRNATCCNNKCVDLHFDSESCGLCKKKCLFTQVCCNGECVDTAYDKRHCGRCNNKCFRGQYCIYGMCDYA